MATMPMLRRRRLQRALDAVNASVLPFVLVPKKRVEGRLSRWELYVLTVQKNVVERGCSNSAPAIPLGRWRVAPPAWSDESWRSRHPGADVLPFRHPPVYSEAEQRVRLAELGRRMGQRLTG